MTTVGFLFGSVIITTLLVFVVNGLTDILIGGPTPFITLLSEVIDNGKLFLGPYRYYIRVAILFIVLIYVARWILSLLRGDDLPGGSSSHRSTGVNGRTWSS